MLAIGGCGLRTAIQRIHTTHGGCYRAGCGDDDDEVCCAAFIGRDYICTRSKAVHQLGEMVVGSGGRSPVLILEFEGCEGSMELRFKPVCERVNAEPYTCPCVCVRCADNTW